MSQLFATPSEIDPAGTTMANAPMGTRTSIGRYKMPCLPGEEPPKSPKGADWVSGGLQSATNLAGSISETRALGIWERERTQLGLAERVDLYERLAMAVSRARHAGWDPSQKLRSSPAGQALKAELGLLHEEARQACKANEGAQLGTNRHDAWEEFGKTGRLFGTPAINSQLQAVSDLLAEKGLRRTGLRERVVRNMELRCAGRFDDVLQVEAEITFEDGKFLRAGEFVMSDLKTKRDQFWGYLEPRIQLTVYATAEYMLDGAEYVAGPRYHVNQRFGVLLHAPADGKKPRLVRVDLERGLEYARLARAVCDARSESKNVAAHRDAEW